MTFSWTPGINGLTVSSELVRFTEEESLTEKFMFCAVLVNLLSYKA